jgi:hypothetical protein
VTVAETLAYDDGENHTTIDNRGIVDFTYLGKLCKFNFRALASASSGLLPNDLAGQAAQMEVDLSGPALKAAGAKPRIVDSLVAAAGRFQVAAAAYAVRKPLISPSRWNAVSDGLTSLERYWYTHLSALDAQNSTLDYPWDQPLNDIENMKAGIQDLVHGSPKQAIRKLQNVSLTSEGLQFSPAVYAAELKRFLPDYYLPTWGGQVDQSWHVNLIDIVRQIHEGKIAAAIKNLRIAVASDLHGVVTRGARHARVHIDGLNKRLAQATAALNVMTRMANDLR